jgi:hypothetical protein
MVLRDYSWYCLIAPVIEMAKLCKLPDIPVVPGSFIFLTNGKHYRQ